MKQDELEEKFDTMTAHQIEEVCIKLDELALRFNKAGFHLTTVFMSEDDYGSGEEDFYIDNKCTGGIQVVHVAFYDVIKKGCAIVAKYRKPRSANKRKPEPSENRIFMTNEDISRIGVDLGGLKTF